MPLSVLISDETPGERPCSRSSSYTVAGESLLARKHPPADRAGRFMLAMPARLRD